jgi:hypothetical protein
MWSKLENVHHLSRCPSSYHAECRIGVVYITQASETRGVIQIKDVAQVLGNFSDGVQLWQFCHDCASHLPDASAACSAA